MGTSMNTPMTMAQKSLARSAGRDHAAIDETLTCSVDAVMVHEAFAICAIKMLEVGVERVWDPDRVMVVLDHYFPAPTEMMAGAHRAARALAKQMGVNNFLGYAGVGNQVMIERGFALPGELVLGSDSHSTTWGAVGCAGSGLGLTELNYIMATGEIWLKVPPTIRFELNGDAAPGLMSKDIALQLLGRFGREMGQYRAVEYGGPVAEHMSLSSRMTMANMAAELGAKFAFFEADAKICEYLAPRVGRPVQPFGPDKDADYEAVHQIDVSAIEPMVACPHSPDNVKPISQVEKVSVDQVYLGSCTNARMEDMAVAAEMLRGRRVHDSTRMLVTPASQEVMTEATRAGYTEVLLSAGAHFTTPGCGACPGGHSGLVGALETCISTTNRNFRGRMGSTEAQIYLGSPATVAASAIEGRIADPRPYLTKSLP